MPRGKKHTTPSASKRRVSAASMKKKRDRRPKKIPPGLDAAVQSVEISGQASEAPSKTEEMTTSPPFIHTTVESNTGMQDLTKASQGRTADKHIQDETPSLKIARSWLKLLREFSDVISMIVNYIKWFFLVSAVFALICMVMMTLVIGPEYLRTQIKQFVSWVSKLSLPTLVFAITTLLSWLGFKTRKSWLVKLRSLKLPAALSKIGILAFLDKFGATKSVEAPPDTQAQAVEEAENLS